MSERLLIVAPLRLEACIISRGRPPARIHHGGMGPRRASATVPALLADPAEALLVLGFGGGLAAGSRAGEVVVAEEVRGPEGARVACAGAPELAALLAARGLSVRSGAVSSVPRLALGAARAKLHETGAIAVDMESVWLAAAARGRPFAVVRVLSDTPSQELTRPLRMVAGLTRAARTLSRVAAALGEWVP